MISELIKLSLFTFFISNIMGCATIVGEPSHLMPINSTPSGATVYIADEKDTQVYKGLTPTYVTLPKSDGSYMGGKNYTVMIEKEGFGTQYVVVSTNPNSWYYIGNLLTWGPIGCFVVDPFTGDMYNVYPVDIHVELLEKSLK